MIPALIFLVELLISVTVFIWVAAMLGFADDAHRNQKAGLLGKSLVIAGMAIATIPLLTTLYAAMQYYFPEKFSVKVPLVQWLPLIIAMASFIAGRRIARLYDASYKKKGKTAH